MSTSISNSTESPTENMSFEQAYELLEKIVSALDNEEMPLERSLELYERGQALARRCIQLLENAETRILQIAGDQLEPLWSGSPEND